MTPENGHNTPRKEQFGRAIRLLHAGRSEEAATLLVSLHEQAPHDVEVALNLGGAYILQQRYEEAVEVLEPATRLAPESAHLWVNLAAAHLGLLEESNDAQQERAISAYEQALTANPDAPNVHYMLGLIYRSRKENLRATAHFTRALEQDPTDNDARRMLAAGADSSDEGDISDG
ncbi:MAG: tetratricopeptide repeat protein [Ardenticatenaceae bacterium]